MKRGKKNHKNEIKKTKKEEISKALFYLSCLQNKETILEVTIDMWELTKKGSDCSAERSS